MYTGTLDLNFQKKKKQQESEGGEDGNGNGDTRVSVIETSTGRTLTGEDAPSLSQLPAFLESHPGWEAIDSDSDDEDSEDEDNEGKFECMFALFAIYQKDYYFEPKINSKILFTPFSSSQERPII